MVRYYKIAKHFIDYMQQKSSHSISDLKNKKIGLTLSGGLVLGAAHIGVLKAMEEFDIRPAKIVGISVGAIIGALYCSGLSIKKIEEIAINLSWWDLATVSITKTGLLSNKKMGDLILKNTSIDTFDALKYPLVVVATDAETGKYVLIDQGNLPEAVRASTALPGIFQPVEIDGRVLIDGGLSTKAMYEPLARLAVDYTIAVDLQLHQPLNKPHNMFETMYNAFEIMIEEFVMPKGAVHLRIDPDLSGYNRTDTTQTADIIQTGYERAKTIFNEMENAEVLFE